MREILLTDGWRLVVTDAGAVERPGDLDHIDGWLPAAVPGTAAAALQAAGQFDPDDPKPLHDKDVWYLTELASETEGDRILRFEGLATISEVYLNGVLVLQSRNMFRDACVSVTLGLSNTLAICFRALQPHLEQKGPRARWRPKLATSQGLRLVRTTLLGHMPGWCPEIHSVGPYRPITLINPAAVRIVEKKVQAELGPDGTGTLIVDVTLSGDAGDVILGCAGQTCGLSLAGDGRYSGSLSIEAVEPWMPHTHGRPALHEIALVADGQSHDLGKVGFRRIDVDRGEDGKGFGLRINDVPVFCRGAVWTCADLLHLPGDTESYRPWLEMARDAGMNMLRIGGTMTYEARAFYELCDELGILVWQDFQFANYDYPVKDEAFVEEVKAEVRHQLTLTQGCPSLAVLCGGSEIYQQGAMMGLPESRWKGPLCEEILPELAAECRPDVAYVPNSPCGGALPFSPNEQIAHYYGVGAYRLPLDDLRRSNVRFAGECLAFSNIPQERSLQASLPVKPGHDPRWKAGVPRDRGAGWDFEDIRDHYLKTLYGVDPLELRYSDPDRYLDLGRAVTGDVMAAAYSEWRRPQSTCRGALVWTFQDLKPGAGWGLIGADGTPKPAYYALKRAFQSLHLAVTDEATNGLDIHVVNEADAPRDVVLSLTCLKNGSVPVVSGKRDLLLPARDGLTINGYELIGAFFDVTNAYRFGPPSHDVTIVRLSDPTGGETLAEAFHFPLGHAPDRYPLDIETKLEVQDNGCYRLELHASRFYRSVHLDIPGFTPSDDWFHMGPGAGKTVLLVPRDKTEEPTGAPVGSLAALNGHAPLRIS